MTGENKYSVLKQVSILMGIAVAGIVIDFVVTFTNGGISSTEASSLYLYAVWTIWALRILVWSLILAALSRLADLRKAFGKARIWYCLRIVAFIIALLSAAIFNYWRSAPVSDSRLRFALLATLAFIAAMSFLGYALEMGLGNRAVLFAGAELLESFGLDSPAKENRRCAKRLSELVAAQTFLLILAVGFSAWLVLVKGASLRDPDALLAVLFLLDVAVILLCLFTGLAVMAFGILAALRMGRTYRAIKELTE